MLEIVPGAKTIVSSGYPSDAALAEYQDNGFQGVVTKPYRIKDLSETVYSVIHWV